MSKVLAECPTFCDGDVIEHPDQSPLNRGERAYLADCPSLWGCQGKSLKFPQAREIREWTHSCLLLSSLTPFLHSPGCKPREWQLLTVGWALLCKLIIKTVLLTGMSTDQPDRGKPSLILSSPVNLDCGKLNIGRYTAQAWGTEFGVAACASTPAQEGQKQEIPWVCWSASLAKSAGSQVHWETLHPSIKMRWRVIEEVTHKYWPHTCSWIYTDMYTHTFWENLKL